MNNLIKEILYPLNSNIQSLIVDPASLINLHHEKYNKEYLNFYKNLSTPKSFLQKYQKCESLKGYPVKINVMK